MSMCALGACVGRAVALDRDGDKGDGGVAVFCASDARREKLVCSCRKFEMAVCRTGRSLCVEKRHWAQIEAALEGAIVRISGCVNQLLFVFAKRQIPEVLMRHRPAPR